MDHLFIHQIGGRNFRQGLQRVPLGENTHRPHRDHPAFNGRVFLKPVGDAAIILLADDPFQNTLGAVGLDGDGDISAVFKKLRDQLGQVTGGKTGQTGDAQMSGLAARNIAAHFRDILHGFKQALDFRQQISGLLGQHQPTSFAVIQLKSQLGGQVRQQPAGCGLRDAQIFGGTRHRAPLGQCVQGFKLSKAQGLSHPISFVVMVANPDITQCYNNIKNKYVALCNFPI